MFAQCCWTTYKICHSGIDNVCVRTQGICVVSNRISAAALSCYVLFCPVRLSICPLVCLPFACDIEGGSGRVCEKGLDDVWKMDASVAYYIFFKSELASCLSEDRVEKRIFDDFLQHVQSGYSDLPYHCYTHAVDVLHTVPRSNIGVKI